jgi:hypothetical protein
MYRIKFKTQSFKRTAYITAAFIVALAGVMQAFLGQRVYAFPDGSQLADREIRISSSASGATGVTYLVAFEPASNYTIQGIIVDFCGGVSSTNPGTPIINDSDCDLPTGFDIGTPSVTVTSVDDDGDATIVDLGAGTGGTWTATDHSANNQTLRLTHSGTGPSLSAGTRYGFTINGVTNPTPVETFYARIITYTSSTEDVTTYTHSAADDGDGTIDAQDYGGIALSTAAQISITARVRESLTFCVSAANPGAGCSGTSAPTLLLNNGSEDIVDTAGVSTASSYIQASTNAQSGVVVRMRNTASCAGLSRDSGTTCDIVAIGSTPSALGSIPSPDGLFGMYVNDTGGTALNAAAPYETASSYAMDDNTTDGVRSTYGDIITASTGPLDAVENILVFGARASNTTEAGLYTATIIINATGTF